jgi:hypothetical protein
LPYVAGWNCNPLENLFTTLFCMWKIDMLRGTKMLDAVRVGSGGGRAAIKPGLHFVEWQVDHHGCRDCRRRYLP